MRSTSDRDRGPDQSVGVVADRDRAAPSSGDSVPPDRDRVPGAASVVPDRSTSSGCVCYRADDNRAPTSYVRAVTDRHALNTRSTQKDFGVATDDDVLLRVPRSGLGDPGAVPDHGVVLRVASGGDVDPRAPADHHVLPAAGPGCGDEGRLA